MIGFSEEAMQALARYDYPGNVRELENIVERAVLLSRQAELTAADLPPELLSNSASSSTRAVRPELVGDVSRMTLREALEEPERQIILQSLRAHNWNRAATADTLGVNRTTLYKKMKKLGLDDPRLQFMGGEVISTSQS